MYDNNLSYENAPQPPTGPRIGPWQALQREWPIALLITIASLALAFAVGMSIPTSYKAEVRMAVGRFSITSPGSISTFATATSALAAQYSRALDADPIVDPIARKYGISRDVVRARLSATPIPDSPVFRIQATAATAAEAQRMANDAGTLLVRYTTKLNQSNPDSKRLLREFQVASRESNERREELRSRRDDFKTNRSPANRRAVIDAETKAQTAALRLNSLRTAFGGASQSEASTSLVQPLTRASTATSTRGSTLQIVLFIGLVAGAAIGTAVVTMRANQRLRHLVPSGT